MHMRPMLIPICSIHILFLLANAHEKHCLFVKDLSDGSMHHLGTIFGQCCKFTSDAQSVPIAVPLPVDSASQGCK